MLPKIPANVFLRLFIVSSDSGSSRSRAIASTVPGDGGPDGRGGGKGAGDVRAGTAAEGGADDGLYTTPLDWHHHHPIIAVRTSVSS